MTVLTNPIDTAASCANTCDPACVEHRPDRSGRTVCHIGLGLQTGYLEELLSEFARSHDPNRWVPEFIVFDEAGEAGRRIRALGHTVRELNCVGESRIAQIRRLVQLFRILSPTVVHTHSTTLHLCASLAARVAHVPVIVNTRHGRQFVETWRERWSRQLGAFTCDRVLSVPSPPCNRSSRDADPPAPDAHSNFSAFDRQLPFDGQHMVREHEALYSELLERKA